jgi:hypothetical protein
MYDTEDTPLFDLHIKAVGKALWVCTSRHCDGIHHYYRNANAKRVAA